MGKYLDSFNSYEDMTASWSGSQAVKDEEVIVAEYDRPPYEGSAHCVYQRDGKLFEVNDSHCSCRGLEYWEPEETSFAAILMRPNLTPEFRRLIEEAQS